MEKDEPPPTYLYVVKQIYNPPPFYGNIKSDQSVTLSPFRSVLQSSPYRPDSRLEKPPNPRTRQ